MTLVIAVILIIGFVGLTEVMGADSTIAQSARVSYGKNNSKVDVVRDTNLIRYMLRHRHTSPFEMCEVRFHLKIPIFVMRQHIRHRTWSTNEYSGRYSVMSDEFYTPSVDRAMGQSKTNNQQSEGMIDFDVFNEFDSNLRDCYHHAYDTYKKAIDSGISRETARIALPLANYTELYCKVDLRNFFQYVKLRLDPSHAQYEIVELARLMYDKVKEHFPISCQAFEDYELNAITFSQLEINTLKHLLKNEGYEFDFRMSEREMAEFKEKIQKVLTHES